MEAYTHDGIADGLETRTIGRYIRWHDMLPSTNDLAKRLAEVQVPEGTVIVAEEQTSGRGRLGRPWVSPRGGVWLSVILRPRLPLAHVPLIGLAAATAVARAIRVTTGLLARVKWPNDVLVDGHKVVGILVESGTGAEWVVVGIGINANVPRRALPVGTGYPVTSLELALGQPVDRGVLVRTLLREFEQRYDELQAGGVLATLRRWREIADTLGRVIRVEAPLRPTLLPHGGGLAHEGGQAGRGGRAGTVIEGVAVDIDESGALLVKPRDGTLQRVVAGDIALREVG